MNNMQKENLGSILGLIIGLAFAMVVGSTLEDLQRVMILAFIVLLVAYIITTQTQMSDSWRIKVHRKNNKEAKR